MKRPIETRLSTADREAGFTLIEVLVAAVILALAALAVFGTLTAATRNAQRAQATQVALDKAQEEMEKLHALSYSELVMTRFPEHVIDPLNPNYRVNGRKFAAEREPLGELAEMVVESEPLYGGGFLGPGTIKPGPINFDDGNVSGQIYRYVLWRNDPTCPESEVGTEDFCPGKQDYKQLVVAVKLDSTNQLAPTNYVEVQSQVVNPEAQAQRSTQGEGPGPGGGGNSQQEEEEREREEREDETGGLGTGKAITAQQFFLTDTPCSASGSTVRQTITGDHLLHDTLGVCASGPQTGEKLGAPDALLREAPPDPAPDDESNPALYNYSSDSYLAPSPDTAKGLELLHDDTAGCHYQPTSGVHPEAKVHRWVTDPMPRDFMLSGTATLEFYSRTINEASYPGTVCVYLFKRIEKAVPTGIEMTDIQLGNAETGMAYWSISSEGNSSWPRTEWTKMRLTMKIAGAPFIIHPGERLGVALSVDAGTTPAEGIPIIYDHPNYPTRLEVDTTTPFEGE
jgi:prepilin-type N-terminal cleavage/methylation domain-containing protein